MTKTKHLVAAALASVALTVPAFADDGTIKIGFATASRASWRPMTSPRPTPP